MLDIAHTNGRWIAASGGLEGLPYSDNSLYWKAHPQFSAERAPYLCDLELHDGLFIASGQDRIILQSSDGNNWQALSHPNTGTSNGLLEAIHYSNGTWAAVGTAGTIIYSEDGATWNKATTGGEEPLKTIHFAHRIWVAAGDGVSLYWSNNPKDWTLGFFPIETEIIAPSLDT
jgi:hypothetical protein